MGRPGIYFKAGSATTEGPGPDPQSTFTPNLLSLGIYFQRPAGTFYFHFGLSAQLGLDPQNSTSSGSSREASLSTVVAVSDVFCVIYAGPGKDQEKMHLGF